MRFAVSILCVCGVVAVPARARAQSGFFPGSAPAPASASAPAEKPVRFGVRAGLSLATLHGHVDPTFGDKIDASGVEKRTGIGVSVFADFHVAAHFGIEAALGYEQKGFSGKDPPGGAAGGTIALDYLQVPVLAVGRLPVGRSVRLRGFGGPSIGYLLIARARRGGDSQDTQPEMPARYLTIGGVEGQDIEQYIATFDLGLVVGGGVDVDVPGGLLLVDLRYELGLTSIDGLEGADIENRVFSINAGYAF